MSRQEGVKFTCDRCGKNEFIAFRPLSAKYGNEVHSEWIQVVPGQEIWLCPCCAEIFKDMVSSFINEIDPLKI
jgi:Zn-finger protein